MIKKMKEDVECGKIAKRHNFEELWNSCDGYTYVICKECGYTTHLYKGKEIV